MSEIKMRTRILAQMTNYEVEDYLKRNDIIFVPTGPTEMSGSSPLDIEYVACLGFALECAERVDGLVMDGLRYFFNGASATGRGTVKMSVRDGYNYLKQICYSLIESGFRRIILCSGHGTSELTIGAIVGDFFDETKMPVAWMDVGTTTQYARSLMTEEELKQYHHLMQVLYGCYEKLGRRDWLVVDPETTGKTLNDDWAEGDMPKMEYPESLKNLEYMMNFSTFSYACSFYFGDVTDHGGDDGAFRSEEEREKACVDGLAQLKKMIDLVDIPLFVESMRAQNEYTRTVVYEKHGDHLPWSKAFPWKSV